MAVSADDLRVAGFLMAAAYVAMGAGAFVPAWLARLEVEGPPTAQRPVHPVVEGLWAGVQVVLIAGLAAAFLVPQTLLDFPTSALRYSSPALAFGGVAVFVLGALLGWWAARNLGPMLTVAIETREGGELVTSGPYARIRHPIYTGIFLQVAGLGLALASPLVALALPVAVFCGAYRARLEEELLGSDPRIGPAYRAYQGRSGRFLPPLGRA